MLEAALTRPECVVVFEHVIIELTNLSHASHVIPTATAATVDPYITFLTLLAAESA